MHELNYGLTLCEAGTSILHHVYHIVSTTWSTHVPWSPPTSSTFNLCRVRSTTSSRSRITSTTCITRRFSAAVAYAVGHICCGIHMLSLVCRCFLSAAVSCLRLLLVCCWSHLLRHTYAVACLPLLSVCRCCLSAAVACLPLLLIYRSNSMSWDLCRRFWRILLRFLAALAPKDPLLLHAP